MPHEERREGRALARGPEGVTGSAIPLPAIEPRFDRVARKESIELRALAM